MSVWPMNWRAGPGMIWIFSRAAFHGNAFTYAIEAEPGLERFLIPKLTLQPLVENALLHGIRKTKGRKGHIRISAYLAEGDLLILVSDDGVGMEEPVAGRLLVEPRPAMRADGSGSSYGLFNVHERIRYFAGELYGLAIRTAPGERDDCHGPAPGCGGGERRTGHFHNQRPEKVVWRFL